MILQKVTFWLLLVFLVNLAKSQDEMPTDRSFFIQSALSYSQVNTGYWDVPGYNITFKAGQNLCAWELSDQAGDRKFRMEYVATYNQIPYYRIVPEYANGKGCVDVANNERRNGANIQVWDKNQSDAQLFSFKHIGSGRWKIFNKNGLAVCLDNRSQQNGSNIHLWDDHQGQWMEWHFLDVNNYQAYIPQSQSQNQNFVQNNPGQSTIYTLEPGEEFVYGKVGVNAQGQQYYTAAIVCKPNSNKPVYRSNFEPYEGVRPIGEPLMTQVAKPEQWDLYDYWLIFNGKKFGPFDRILDMKQERYNIDDWVSPDGQYISFCGAIGNKYQAYIANEKATMFWTTFQAPEYAIHGNKWAYSIEFSKANFRLYENQAIKQEGVQKISNLAYSKGGSLIYSFAKNDNWFVNVDHQTVAGPFERVGEAGFVPGTNRIYYKILRKSFTCSKVVIGSQSVDIPDENQTVSNFHFGANKIVFSVSHNISKQITSYEYDIANDQLKSYGPYLEAIRYAGNNEIFYFTYAANDKKLIVVGEGGREIVKINDIKLEKHWEYGINIFVSPTGTPYLVYHIDKPAGMKKSDFNKYFYKIYKNNEPYPFKGDIAWLEKFDFDKASGEPFIISRLDKSVGAMKNRVDIGSHSTEIDGNISASSFFVGADKQIYSLNSTMKSGNFSFQIHKNGQAQDEPRQIISNFFVTGNGNRYVFLFNGQHISSDPGYIPINKCMHKNWLIYINGKSVDGKFGLPVWSASQQKIIAIKQVGQQLQVVEI
jgi:hypothetical protein